MPLNSNAQVALAHAPQHTVDLTRTPPTRRITRTRGPAGRASLCSLPRRSAARALRRRPPAGRARFVRRFTPRRRRGGLRGWVARGDARALPTRRLPLRPRRVRDRRSRARRQPPRVGRGARRRGRPRAGRARAPNSRAPDVDGGRARLADEPQGRTRHCRGSPSSWGASASPAVPRAGGRRGDRDGRGARDGRGRRRCARREALRIDPPQCAR